MRKHLLLKVNIKNTKSNHNKSPEWAQSLDIWWLHWTKLCRRGNLRKVYRKNKKQIDADSALTVKMFWPNLLFCTFSLTPLQNMWSFQVHPSSLKSYQEVCRQLDAWLTSSCLLTQPEIKRCPRTPAARAPQRPEPQLARCASDVTLQLSGTFAVSSAKRIHPGQHPLHIVTRLVSKCHRELQVFKVYIWPWNRLSPLMNSSKHRDTITPQDHVQQGITVAKLSASTSAWFNKYIW